MFAARSSRAASFLFKRPTKGMLPLDIHPDVRHALANRSPIVALETAIVTHGLPPPTSLSLPLELEHLVREGGATPAHIGIVGGKVKIGLERDELERLADPDAGRRKWKVGRREIAGALVAGVDGGTTVSGTMLLAHLAGIKVFVTGGIGGVHRGAQSTMDVSSDLTELAKTPVAVVCAGAKSILDIGLTLEFLETQGVPVCAYGPTDEFPAFYTPKSGFRAPMNFFTPSECASLIDRHWNVDPTSGVLFGVPIPSSSTSAGAKIQAAVDRAVRESEGNGMSKRGKEVTPWLLSRVKELTGGLSVEANVALIRNNVEVGTRIAVEYAKLVGGDTDATEAPNQNRPSPRQSPKKARVLVIGSAAVDVSSRQSPEHPLDPATTVPGSITVSTGGVARNIAEAAFRLGIEDVALVGPVGDDGWAGMVKGGMEEVGMRTDGLVEEEGAKTAVCSMVHDAEGELLHGVADMDIVDRFSGQSITAALDRHEPKVVCLDGNLSSGALHHTLDVCRPRDILTVFEPTSNPKSVRVLPAFAFLFDDRPSLSLMVPNLYELEALTSALRSRASSSSDSDGDDGKDGGKVFGSSEWFAKTDSLKLDSSFRAAVDRELPRWVTERGALQMAVQTLPAVGMLFVKNGGKGVVVVGRAPCEDVGRWREGRRWIVSKGGLVVAHFPPSEDVEDVENVNGAGDSLCGAVLAGLASGLGLDSPRDVERLVDISQRAAIRTIRSPHAVGDMSDLRGRFVG